jgi:hypothetical protein
MADPEMALAVAELLVNGATRQDIADVYGLGSLHTVTRWKSDPRVQVHIKRLIHERTYEITRKTDTEILNRLSNPEELTVKEILAIRQEFLGGTMREETESIDEATINEAAALLEDNPEAADMLREMLKGAVVPVAPEPSSE